MGKRKLPNGADVRAFRRRAGYPRLCADVSGPPQTTEPPFERLTTSGVRFSDIAAGAPDKPLAIRSGHDILVAQRDDLRILRQKLVEVIDAYRNAMPLTEKGEFVRVMLSGRNAFGSKMPQFTEMMSAYDRFIVRSCMTTIDATMQVYPVGWEWLQPRK